MKSSNKTASTRAHHVFSMFFFVKYLYMVLGDKTHIHLRRTWPPKYTNYTHRMMGITHPKWLVAFYFRWNMFQPILKSYNLIGLSNPLHPMLGEVAVFLWSLSFVHFGPRNSRHFNPDMFIFVSWWPPPTAHKKTQILLPILHRGCFQVTSWRQYPNVPNAAPVRDPCLAAGPTSTNRSLESSFGGSTFRCLVDSTEKTSVYICTMLESYSHRTR